MKKIENYEILKVKRSEIKEAPYNPRMLNEEAEKKLSRGIKKYGLVEPLIWNKRSGNLVGGHQRLKILDKLNKGEDYEITVAAIDVDEKTEKKINVFLNNTLAQGDWDSEKLKDLVLDIGEIEDIGFSDEEILAICPFPEIQEIIDKEIEREEPEKDTLSDEMDLMERAKVKHAEWKQKAAQLDDAEFYVVLVFENREQTDEFLKLCGYNLNNRFQDGRLVLNLIKKVK